MESKKVKVGVIGLGNMGSQHLSIVASIESMELAACCDIIPERAEQYGKQYNIPYFTNSEDLISSGLVDAVTIAVPHYFHTPIAVSALSHNLHVLTEKPVAVHKNDVLRMIKAHSEHPDKIFAAMFQMRTIPIYQKVRELIQRGEFGKIQRVSWVVTSWFRSQAYYDSGTWRATWKGEGGGVLLNQCPHHIDLFWWLFGMPSKIRAVCNIGKYHKIEVEDEVTAYYEYPDGMTATFITSTGEAPGTNRLEIACDRGRVVVEDGKISFLRNEIPTQEFRDTTQTSFSTPTRWEIDVPVPADPNNGENHKAILRNFADAILNGAKLIAPAEDGLHSVELANSMLYSSMNKTDVEIPLDGDAFEAMLHKLIETSTFEKGKSSENKPSDFSSSFGK